MANLDELQGKRRHTRRRFLLGTAAAGVALGGELLDAGQEERRKEEKTTVRDRLWLFACPAGTDNGPKNRWGLPGMSRMTPAEGAFYLNVPNLMMVRAQDQFTKKDLPPLPQDQYAIALRPLKRVAWSITGSGGKTSEAAREDTLRLAGKFPNITGFIMDDFFKRDGSGQLSVEQLAALRKRFVIGGRKRDLHVVLYTHQLELPVGKLLAYCDKITLWTWHAKELIDLEKNFERLEKLAPKHGKLLGCYTWDYPNKRPVPMEMMRKQCELGLKWLRQGRIEGMVFLANTTGDFDVEAWQYARKWIAQVGDQPL